MRSSLHHVTRQLLDWLLPSQCLLCGSATDNNPLHVPLTLCENCHKELIPKAVPACTTCGAPLGPYANPSGKCPHCHGRRFRFQSVTCLGMYDGALRSMLLAGKWSTSSSNIRTLARIYAKSRTTELKSLNVDRIIPVPQIWHRRLRRNFNAAGLIAAEIGRLLDRPVDFHVLRRSRGTKLQKRASLAERTAIQKDSFRIRDAHMISGERLLLTDDVLTTGATCNEAVRMLLEAGALECHVAVLARVSSNS